MRFLGFATLNYDPQLPSEFFLRFPDPAYFSVYPSAGGLTMPLEFLSPPPRLIALHGYSDSNILGWEEQIILKRSDYNHHYIDGPRPLFRMVGGDAACDSVHIRWNVAAGARLVSRDGVSPSSASGPSCHHEPPSLTLREPGPNDWRVSHGRCGPVTMQERWEECSGYSPSTLAISIAALVIVAEFARDRDDEPTADFALAYADWLESHLEDWTVTTRGELVAGKPRHYVRITPAPAENPYARAEPDTAILEIGNGGGKHPARNVVSLEFLQLVRLGVRDPFDPVIVETVAVIDQVLRHELPPGPSWQRYNHDGYGQHEDGAAFDGTGAGGCWPLLTGERGHYELAAGRDPKPYIGAMERFANKGGMLPEQVWCGDDLPNLKRGAAYWLGHATLLGTRRVYDARAKRRRRRGFRPGSSGI